MKLYTFSADARGLRRLGVEREGQMIDLPVAYAAMVEAQGPKAGMPRLLPPDMAGFIRMGAPALAAAGAVIEFLRKRPAVPVGDPLTYLFESVKIEAPLRPGKILCSGINYRNHQEENPDAKMPEEPFFFAKMPSAVIGPGAPIRKPRQTQQLDYEVEFAVVIGKRMQAAPESEVMGSIFGYTILHDVSARDVQFKDSQITLGKNFDTFCPLGPCIVTADALPHPDGLELSSRVNGRLRQNGSTSGWIFPLPRLLSFLSSVMTLEAGDVVSTGTPAGVGLFQKPPVFLEPGDVVTLEIEGIGKLENPVVDAAG